METDITGDAVTEDITLGAINTRITGLKTTIELYKITVDSLIQNNEQYAEQVGNYEESSNKLDELVSSIATISKSLSENIGPDIEKIKGYESKLDELKTEFGYLSDKFCKAIGKVYTQESGDHLYELVESMGTRVDASFRSLDIAYKDVLSKMDEGFKSTQAGIKDYGDKTIDAVNDVKGTVPVEVYIKGNNAQRAALEQVADILEITKATGGLPADFDKNRHDRFMALISSNNEVQKGKGGDMTAAGFAGTDDKRYLDASVVRRIAEAGDGELSDDLKVALYKTILGKNYQTTPQEEEQSTE